MKTDILNPTRIHSQHAFTLVELLVAIAILGIIVSVAIPSYQAYIERANVAEAIADINRIDAAMAMYEGENLGRLPDSLADIGMRNLLDPWDNPYQYLKLSGPNATGMARKDKNLVPINSDYDLYSSGKDGSSVSPLTAKASRDDIVRAANGRFIGKASDF